MRKSLFLNLTSFAILFTSCVSTTALRAQSYLGDYNPAPAQAPKEDVIQSPIPKIFSYDLQDKVTGHEVDKIYNNLIITVWIYANGDFVAKKQLMSLLEDERFKTTRYKAEFQRPLDSAMNTLNTNHQEMTYFLDDAEAKYHAIFDKLVEADQNTIRPIWDEKFGAFKNYTQKYFKMQGQFLKQYHKLAGFILDKNGQYYFDTNSMKMRFYDYQNYEYFAKNIDALRKLNFAQLKHVKTLVPAKSDIILDAKL